MDHATVAPLSMLLLLLLLLQASSFSCAVAADSGPVAAEFGYPDEDHVIITQYGPMRYEPMSADQLNRPYDGGGGGGAKTTPARGYFKAEVIPLDMKTWKPLDGGGSDESWAGGRGGADAGPRARAGPARHGGTGPKKAGGTGPGRAGPGRAGPGRFGGGELLDTFDVPLRVGYSVRPAKPVRRRRHDYLMTSPRGQLHRYPGPRSPPRRATADDPWRPT